MGKEQIVIDILGTTLRVNTDEDPRYLSQIIDYLHEKTAEVKSTTRIDDPLKVSILTSVYLIDELYKERFALGGGDTAEQVSELAIEIIKKLDETLES